MNIANFLRSTLNGILAVVIVLGAGACSGDRQAARRGGTMIVGDISAYESLNPMYATDAHARDVYDLLFLSLLFENDDFLTFRPRLARSWEFSEDRLALTFHLRDDVVWSDGVKFTARDVAATFRAQKNPDVLWSGRHLKEHIDSVQVIDDLTAVYHFSQAYPYQIMDANDGPILPAHMLEETEPSMIRNIPVEDMPTDGPFKIESWVKGQSLTLVPNPLYYEKGKPYLDKVIFKIIPDQMTLITQLRAGEIDCMESIPYGEVENLRKANPDLEIFAFQSRLYHYIGYNAINPHFSSPRVRRALTLAINRKLIIDNLCYGFAEECSSPFVPLIWAYDPDIKPLPFDPDEARRILSEEGYADSDGDGYLDKDGKIFEFELMTNQGNQTRADIQVMVQEELKEIGVKVNPVIIEWTVMLEHHKSGDFDALINAWRSGTKADLAPIWSCEARRKGGYNRVNYCNPTVDSLNTLACSILDFEKARPLFNRAQKIIYEEQPYTFLYVPNALFALNRRIKGAKPDPISVYHNLYEWWAGERPAGDR